MPDSINVLRCLSKIDSTFLSAGERSGLIEIPGKCDNCFLLARTVATSLDRLRVTSVGPISFFGIFTQPRAIPHRELCD